MQLLPARRREAICALCAFCRELDDIADGEASRSLKQTLLLNWRREIAHFYEGRPQHVVTRGLNEAVHRYSLRCDDFLAIIDGVEMGVRTDIRRPASSSSIAIASAWQWRSAGGRGASSAERSRQAGASPQNSVVHFSSPRYFAILPRMRSETGSILLASCCRRTAYSQRRRAGCWRSRRYPRHLYWDQATLLSQMGILDHPMAAGSQSAAKLLKLR
jgi:hypothetical protein